MFPSKQYYRLKEAAEATGKALFGDAWHENRPQQSGISFSSLSKHDVELLQAAVDAPNNATRPSKADREGATDREAIAGANTQNNLPRAMTDLIELVKFASQEGLDVMDAFAKKISAMAPSPRTLMGEEFASDTAPTRIDLAGDIVSEGELRSLTALFEGEDAKKTDEAAPIDVDFEYTYLCDRALMEAAYMSRNGRSLSPDQRGLVTGLIPHAQKAAEQNEFHKQRRQVENWIQETAGCGGLELLVFTEKDGKMQPIPAHYCLAEGFSLSMADSRARAKDQSWPTDGVVAIKKAEFYKALAEIEPSQSSINTVTQAEPALNKPLTLFPYQPLRKNPQQAPADIWCPDGYLLVPEAVDVAGAGMFGDEWTGKELGARDVSTPPPGVVDVGDLNFRPEVKRIDGFSKVEGAGTANHGARYSGPKWQVLTVTGYVFVDSEEKAHELWNNHLPKLFDMWSMEYSARHRCEKIIRGLKDALYGNAFQAQGHRLEFGDLFPVKHNFWGSQEIDPVWRDTDTILFPDDSGRFRFVDGRVLLRTADIETYVRRNTDNSADREAADDPAARPAQDGNAYRTEYMNLLDRAVQEHGITNDYQPKAKELTAWFVAQKIDGKPVSGRIAGAMTTIVRLPEMRTGGARKQRRQKG